MQVATSRTMGGGALPVRRMRFSTRTLIEPSFCLQRGRRSGHWRENKQCSASSVLGDVRATAILATAFLSTAAGGPSDKGEQDSIFDELVQSQEEEQDSPDGGSRSPRSPRLHTDRGSRPHVVRGCRIGGVRSSLLRCPNSRTPHCPRRPIPRCLQVPDSTLPASSP